MKSPIFIDLENGGGHVRIDPPANNTSYLRVIIASPRQYGNDGQVTEQPMCMDFYTTQGAAERLCDAIKFSMDRKIEKLMGIDP